MAISYIGSATGGQASNGSDFAIDLTSLSLQEGDIVIVVAGIAVGNNAQNPGVTTSGYTEILNLRSNDSRDAYCSVNRKIMGSSPDTSVTIDASTATGGSDVGLIYAFRGVDTTTPIDVTSTSSTFINGNVSTSPPITPVTSGAMILIGGVSTSTSVLTPTAPSGYSSLVISSFDGGIACTSAIAQKTRTGGTETPGAWSSLNGSTTFDSSAAFTMVLRPAPTNNSNFFAFF